MDQLLPCPCCGYRTGCRTCPVCYWTDDGRSDLRTGVLDAGPNGELGLGEARLNFALYGASRRRYASLVRPPRADERP
ncbi:MAG TPA: CPCC family cysteine-rich protein [Micromonosporaceae bacterium]|jgi:Cysteine-rich CPCC